MEEEQHVEQQLLQMAKEQVEQVEVEVMEKQEEVQEQSIKFSLY